MDESCGWGRDLAADEESRGVVHMEKGQDVHELVPGHQGAAKLLRE